jgi:hypothetical protein
LPILPHSLAANALSKKKAKQNIKNRDRFTIVNLSDGEDIIEDETCFPTPLVGHATRYFYCQAQKKQQA